MAFLSKITTRAQKLARYIERPDLWRLRQQGLAVDAYLQLDREWLRSLRIATVLDVGANVGQFAGIAHAVWPSASIFSFEPLPDCFDQLKAQMQNCPKFTAFNIALGDQAGDLSFERNAFSASSSFLKMADLHKTNYPHTSESKVVSVRVERLDDKARELALEHPMFVKIDVQGYENRVLLGGEQTIRRASALLIETSFEPLYEGQPLFGDLHRMLVGWGFRFAGAISQELSPIDGRILQADSLFVQQSANNFAPRR